ncbi:unnamed protein product [Linum tenue]|uniref:TIR domain-containing protein n=1 Tax=Linum tenue TaxID=586396 RepID=A0AAV0K852_9ROSI|nr:unnamed protein product [Linum tenue]
MGCFYVEMDYMKWAVTVIGLLPPLLIILYKLWLGRRISNRANNVDNASRTLDSIASASGSADSDTLLPLPFGEYEVFLNFRGPDTRYQITDILFRFLVNLKIRTFKDDDELRKGEGIWPNLVEAIEQSKIYVTIFSENYAYSKWCLKELAVIVERQERNQGCIILPIFYMVDPRDVRHQSGPYLRAFRQHENFFDEETIRIWKAALNKVGALKGWHVKSNDENVRVLSTLTDDCKLYRVREMSHHHSLQLFCNHAFKRDSPPSNFETLSKDIVYVAAGLPLTLKVVGSLLFQEEEAIWKDKLRQLKEIPEEKVVERLKINYDTLNEEAKQIFLDIACFFIGEDKELPSYMWSDCGLFPITNINILIQRSVIEIVKTHLFQMHDQLRDIGREIVRQEDIRHPCKRSRIWSNEKALDILLNKKGTNRVEGIRIHDDRDKKKPGDISKECFMNFLELRYLDIKARMLNDDFSNSVPGLRWLRVSFKYSDRMPNFIVDNLVIVELLDYEGPKSTALSHIQMASKLKVLKLSGYWLDEFRKFPHSESLEILNLDSCYYRSSLFYMDLGIGNFGKLKVLRLKSLWVREITGGMMPSSLTTLHIKSCSCLVRLPTLENLENLTVLSIECCYELEEILGLGGLKSLETLSICHMDALGNVDGLDSLYSLKSLTLRSCDALERLPSMASLSKLLHLEIDSCLGLTEIHGLGGLESLQMLHIYFATSLSHLFGFETLLSFNKLKALTLRGCPVVTLLPLHDLDDDERGVKVAILDSLQELDIRGTVLMLQIFCRMIKLLMFPSLTQLTLTGMEIGNADRELSLDGLESMEELVELHLGDLTTLRSLPSLSKLGKLKRITIDNAPKLRKIEGVTGLKYLEELDLTGCTSLERWPVDELSCLEKLKILYIAPGTSLIDRSALRRKLLKVSIRSRF